MPKKTDAQRRAQKSYMDKFSRLEIRVTPEKRQLIQDHSEQHGESVNGFVNRAIDEAIVRDMEKGGKSC